MQGSPGSHLEKWVTPWGFISSHSFLTSQDLTGRHSRKQRELWKIHCIKVLTNPGGWRWGGYLGFTFLFSEILVVSACRMRKVTLGRGWRRDGNSWWQVGDEGMGERRQHRWRRSPDKSRGSSESRPPGNNVFTEARTVPRRQDYRSSLASHQLSSSPTAL